MAEGHRPPKSQIAENPNKKEFSMKRETVLDQIENTREPWDFLVIGGGATGLGVAVDAAARVPPAPGGAA